MDLLVVSDIVRMEGNTTVLNKVSFTLPRLHKMAIAGETGSGKSSLLKVIAGLVQAKEGAVYFEGKKIKGPEEKLMPGHPHIAYLSQYFELLNHYYVEELLSYANELSEVEANTLYEVCRISHLLKRKTSQLSGGEKQRIALAKVLVTAPKLLLLDEPFSNLDVIHKSILKTVIEDISSRLDITCIVVSHDPLDTLAWADTLLVMKEGRIVQCGAPEVVYHQPVNHYTAALLGTYNLLSKATADKFVVSSHTHIKEAFVRPERIKVNGKECKGLTGTITRKQFYGSYYEFSVDFSGSTVKVRSLSNEYHVGDIVQLSIAASDLWYMDED